MTDTRMPSVIGTRAEMLARVQAARAAGAIVGLVPTMGALHAGHISLVEAARVGCDVVVVTIFVNPTQFGPHEDFSRYPRTLDADLELLAEQGVELVFAPPTAELYAGNHGTRIEVGPVSELLEGSFRPGHFAGVATIVLKLFNIAPAHWAFFGQKDYQQSLVIRRMVADLDVPIEIEVCPIVREADGLALSSRNIYLSAVEREHALALSKSLKLAESLVAQGERRPEIVQQAMQQLIDSTGGVQLDYIALADPHTLAPVETLSRRTVALLAARVGKTRLIDNQILNAS